MLALCPKAAKELVCGLSRHFVLYVQWHVSGTEISHSSRTLVWWHLAGRPLSPLFLFLFPLFSFLVFRPCLPRPPFPQLVPHLARWGRVRRGDRPEPAEEGSLVRGLGLQGRPETQGPAEVGAFCEGLGEKKAALRLTGRWLPRNS